MELITWNVQWCRGVDLVVDAARIVEQAQRLADFDVLCLQEIADNYPDPRLGGNDGDDQFERLAQLLPGFTAIPAVAVAAGVGASAGWSAGGYVRLGSVAVLGWAVLGGVMGWWAAIG
jgi:endonuclease/exonuclease/phosphatase family metal-dependent hydrolase